MNQKRNNRLYGLVYGSEQNLGSQKKEKPKTHATVIFHPCAGTGAMASNFGMRGDVADVMTRE